MNGIFTLSWTNVKSAIVYGALMLATAFVLALTQNVLNAGSIFGLDWKHIIDSSVIATLPILIVFLSLGKNFLTDAQGKFLGSTKVIPDTTSDTKG